MFTELAADLAAISSEWNDKLLKLIDTLPDGTLDTSVNAFIHGLDGRTMFVDSSVDSSSADQTYYETSDSRPQTVQEALDSLRTSITTQTNEVRVELTAATAPLTDTQKTRIGSNIFDATATSSSSSLDGKSESNRLNIIQIAKDVYDVGSYSLGGDGAKDLTYSVKQMMEALLSIHGGAWNSDIDLNHAGVGGVSAQADVASSATVDDSYSGVNSTTEDDINEIRTRIKAIGGTAAWKTALTALYAGGASSLEALLTSTAGTGTKAADNPWGYNWDDVDGLETRLNAVRDFVGQDSVTDSSPAFDSNNFIEDGVSLEQNISNLDNFFGTMSGMTSTIATFVGQDDPADTTPDYSSHNFLVDGMSLEQGLSTLDVAVASGTTLLIDPWAGSPRTDPFDIVDMNTLYRVDTTASGITAYLPTVSGHQGEQVLIKLQSATSSGLTIYPYLTDTVDGEVSYNIDIPRSSLSFVSDGISDWMLV
jgi:copper chaperone CopZ